MHSCWLRFSFAAIAAIALSWAPVLVRADTVYAIIAGDTDDKSVGASSATDIELASQFIQDIAAAYGKYSFKKLRSRDFSRNGLIRELSATLTNVGPKDFVFVYISGHGDMSEKRSEWPKIVFEDRSFVETSELVSMLRNGRNVHRFLVVIDACNGDEIRRPADRAPATVLEFQTAQVIRLFKNLRGGIVVTSSERGYVSYATNDGKGSLFSLEFFRVLRRTLQMQDRDDWATILAKIGSATNEIASEMAGQGQMPKSQILQ